MRLGNILASIGAIIGTIGLICLPIWNVHEHPYLVDPTYPKGSCWILMAQSFIFARPGIILLILGISLFVIAKFLPKKYWKTVDDLIADEIKTGSRNKLLRKKRKVA